MGNAENETGREGEELELISLSAINQFEFCPRRCYLIHAESEFVDNVHTLLGTFEHEHVDQTQHDVRAGVRVEFALPVWSRRLGISGRCDAVEFHPDGSVYPVEHKHCKRHHYENDDLQLAAQAICLEEMLGKSIEKGAIFHHQSNRRREVIIDDPLRQSVESITAQIRLLLKGKRRPLPTEHEKRCRECSLHEICQPEMMRGSHKLLLLKQILFDPEDELL